MWKGHFSTQVWELLSHRGVGGERPIWKPAHRFLLDPIKIQSISCPFRLQKRLCPPALIRPKYLNILSLSMYYVNNYLHSVEAIASSSGNRRHRAEHVAVLLSSGASSHQLLQRRHPGCHWFIQICWRWLLFFRVKTNPNHVLQPYLLVEGTAEVRDSECSHNTYQRQNL